ncbi:family 43 glycosylhydrolase [Arthrobacter sp. D1-29]
MNEITDRMRFEALIGRRTLLLGAAGAAALTAVGLAGGPLGVSTAQAAALTLTNPLVQQRADPHIARGSDGTYYLTASVPAYDRVVLRASQTLAGLATAAEKTIWLRPASGTTGGHIWAPEMHLVDGVWHIYFAAGDAGDVFHVRPYVLRANGPDPMTATWSVLGRITTAWDTFALDATTFVHSGTRYLVWAQAEPGIDTNSNLYISAMSGPATLTGPQVRIAVPTAGWETIKYKVNEGPSVIQRNGRVFISFSASATDASYCLGLLTASTGANLLDAASWTKSNGPVFRTNDTTGQYGPGHNCFTTAEDGSDVLIYHARPYRDVRDPLTDPNRHARAQPLYWRTDGTPDFGIPVPDGVPPIRLKPANFPTRYVRHQDFAARIDVDVTPLEDSQIRLVAGPAGNGSVAMESINWPGWFLTESSGTVALARNDGTTGFAARASFQRRTGLSGAGTVSFESVAKPGAWLRHRNYVLYVEPVAGTLGAADASFTVV